MSEPIRLSKRLIELVGCSRREAELFIEGGWVTVDGEVIDEPQFKVDNQKVELDPQAKATAPTKPAEQATPLRGLNHEYMAQPGGLRRPLRGAGREKT